MPFSRHTNAPPKLGAPKQSRDHVIGLLGVVMLIQSLALVAVLFLRSPENAGGGSAALVPAKVVSGVAGRRLTGRIGKLRSSTEVAVDPTLSLGLDLDLLPGIHDVLSEAEVFAVGASGEGSVVFVTASNGDEPAIVAMGLADSAGGASTALVAAERELSRLWQLKGLTGRRPRYVKVDVVSSVKKVKNLKVRKDTVDMSGIGVRGLAFDWEKGWAFTPDEVMAGALLDSEYRLQLDKVVEVAANRGNFDNIAFPWKADEDVRNGDDTFDKFYTFRTESVFVDMQDEAADERLVPVFRGHRKFESSDYDTLMESANLAGDYLTEKVDERGVFLYSYLPKSDSELDFAEYSITRHAGTVYAMVLLYEETGKKNEELIAAAKRALDYLISDDASADVEAPYSRKPCRCAIDKRGGPDKLACKLGSNGLVVLAIAKYVEVVGDTDGKYTEAGGRYAEWIVGAQRKDGSFVQRTWFPSGKVDEKKYCPYYPGEAVFGLTQLYKIDGNNKWLDVAEKGGEFMINEAKDNPINDHWLMYGLRELNLVRPHRDQVKHAMKMSKVVHDDHQPSIDVEDLEGTYHRTGGSLCSTATTTEGMCAAYEMAKANGLEEDAARIIADVERGAQYQLRAQFRPEGALHLPNPRQVIGGFKADLENWEIRIDYVQHSLSGILCLARARKNERAMQKAL